MANLGSIFLRQEQYAEAKGHYLEALSLFRDIGAKAAEGAVLGFLARVYTGLDDIERAVDTYLAAHELNPSNPALCNNLAERYMDLGKLDEAAQFYAKRIELRPDDALSAYADLGVIALTKDNTSEATDYFGRALAVYDATVARRLQTFESLIQNKAIAFLGLGRSDEAIALVSDAISSQEAFSSIDVRILDLMAAAPSPPGGIAEVRKLLESALPNPEVDD